MSSYKSSLWRPLLWLAMPAVLLRLYPEASTWARYDRDALLAGDWWRLWTGHWVHFSTSHLSWNLLVLLGAGVWLEKIRPKLVGAYAWIAAPLISLVLLIGEPNLEIYGGLSGLATGCVVLLASLQWHYDQPNRTRWTAVLGLVGVKILLESSGRTLFADFDDQSVRPVLLAHAAGAVTGGLTACLVAWFRPTRAQPPAPSALHPEGGI